MHRLIALIAVAALAGCSCPSLEGLDGNFQIRTCDVVPTQPIQVGSAFSVSVDAEEPPAATWTPDDPALLTAEPTEEGADLVAVGVGDARLGVTLDGVSDRFAFQIVRAASATWVDPIARMVEGMEEEGDEALHGEAAGPPLGDTIRLTRGERLPMQLDLHTAGEELVSWTPEALVAEGPAAMHDRRAIVWLEGEGEAGVADDVGTELASIAVEAVPVTAGAAIQLGAYLVDRSGEIDPAAEESLAAYLRAVVTDAAGVEIHQPAVQWTITGPGRVVPMVEQDPESEFARTDVASWLFDRVDNDRWNLGTACVAAVIPSSAGQVAASAWLSPDGAEFFDDATCSGRAGCACSSAQPVRGAPSLAALALIGAAVRRRRA